MEGLLYLGNYYLQLRFIIVLHFSRMATAAAASVLDVEEPVLVELTSCFLVVSCYPVLPSYVFVKLEVWCIYSVVREMYNCVPSHRGTNMVMHTSALVSSFLGAPPLTCILLAEMSVILLH